MGYIIVFILGYAIGRRVTEQDRETERYIAECIEEEMDEER